MDHTNLCACLNHLCTQMQTWTCGMLYIAKCSAGGAGIEVMGRVRRCTLYMCFNEFPYVAYSLL